MEPGSPDARLSHYRLDRLLGAGGMGSVYLAHDLALDRPVAIKFISPDKAEDDSARRRLIREARAAAALDHPNICGVHEVIVEPDGRACIVMQYVEGETLADKLRRGPLDVRAALSIATDIASALAAAHVRKIIHRDLKPQNVIVTPNRRAMLLDFGVATHRTLAPAGDESTATTLTVPGMLVGTPAYMSPEQARQAPLDRRSDLFSLGAVLFECLTGQRAFSGGSVLDIWDKVLHHDPPDVSMLRPELGEQYDELCRRLLAKHPDDRFQSAEELLGALRVVTPDTGRSTGERPTSHPMPAPRSVATRPRLIALGASIVVITLIGVWQSRYPQYASAATPEVMRLYERGTDWIHDGAYHNGRRVLEQAVAQAPAYVPAHIRLAEACSEIDDHRRAQDALNDVVTHVPNERWLLKEDRLRVRAVRALMLRRVDDTVAEYTELTKLHPDDAGAWVDLGRAQDTAALPARARESFDRAIQLDANNAAAHLRQATILSQLGEAEEALREFQIAEDLYRTRANVEGHIEALLRRGSHLHGFGDLAAARTALESAATLAGTLEHREQLIRAQLQLSSVTAFEGQYAKAQEMAKAAVERALDERLETVAADGLIDLAITLLQARLDELETPTVFQSIDAHLQKAISLAEGRNAQRIVARATMQRAALLADAGQPAEAIDLASGILEFLRTNQYRRYELQLLLIMSRSLEYLERIDEGRKMSEDALRVAEQMQSDVQTAFALENLAGFAVASGDLPGAEGIRRRAEAINREQNNLSVLPYDLTNRAELLIRLGRSAEADSLLSEVEAGIAKGTDSYKGRARRVTALRALSAAVTGNFTEAARISSVMTSSPDGIRDSSGKLAIALLPYAHARMGRRVDPATWRNIAAAAAPPASEASYWALYGRLLSGDLQGALAGSEVSLAERAVRNAPELEWRLAALGAAAARQLGDGPRADALAKRAAEALSRVRSTWQDATSMYERRHDLADLLSRAGMNQ